MVVGSPTTDLLESVECLLRDCVRFFTNADRNNYRFSYKLASDRQNTTHKLDRVIMWNMTLRVCLNKSIFLLFSLSRELSPFLLHEHVLSLLVLKLFILSLHSLCKFLCKFVSCFVFSHFNSLPPTSLSLLLHFNCDFHDNLTSSRLTCVKCPSGINLALVLKPRLFGRILYL